MNRSLKLIYHRMRKLLPKWLTRALRRRYYVRVIENFEDRDWPWSDVIRPLVPPGCVVLDLGANVGYLSALFARWVGPSGRVVSVEPVPETFDALATAMQKLFPGRVTPLCRCVSDQPGEVEMLVPDYPEGGPNYYESRIVSGVAHQPGQRLVKARAVTLNDLVTEQSVSPAFIKIDVEGHELPVIQGGRALLQRLQPPLLIEVAGCPDIPGSRAAQVVELLASWGYHPHTLRDGRLVPRQTGDDAVDYLFLTKECFGFPNDNP